MSATIKLNFITPLYQLQYSRVIQYTEYSTSYSYYCKLYYTRTVYLAVYCKVRAQYRNGPCNSYFMRIILTAFYGYLQRIMVDFMKSKKLMYKCLPHDLIICAKILYIFVMYFYISAQDSSSLISSFRPYFRNWLKM